MKKQYELNILDGKFYLTKDYNGTTIKYKKGDRADYISNSGYCKIKYNGNSVCVHRLIYQILFGEIPVGYEVDHINSVQYDNRVCNLRLVTRIENELHKSLKGINIFNDKNGKPDTYHVKFTSIPNPELFPEFNKLSNCYRKGKLSLHEAEMLVFKVKNYIKEYLDKIPTFQQLLDNQ